MGVKADQNIRARFASKHEAVPSGCWEWRAGFFADGYGAFQLAGRPHRANRVAWMIHRGPIPVDRLVCHTCDNRKCVNPDHLWLGTEADNNADSIAKGRNYRGERQHAAKLTEPDVREIRRAYAAKEADTVRLASLFGVSKTQIGYIVRRQSWAWLD